MYDFLITNRMIESVLTVTQVFYIGLHIIYIALLDVVSRPVLTKTATQGPEESSPE